MGVLLLCVNVLLVIKYCFFLFYKDTSYSKSELIEIKNECNPASDFPKMGEFVYFSPPRHGKAKKGSWITLSEWSYDENKKLLFPVCVKTEYVDGEKIKEDTWYSLKDGEFVEDNKNE